MPYSPENFITGKIAEIVFDEMFRRAGGFTVIPFGYENTYPEIAQNARLIEDKETLANIRTAPDFALISHDRTEVILVEVKYRSVPNGGQILQYAKEIQDVWKSVSLFIATPVGFYMDQCANIIQSGGYISPLSPTLIGKSIQDEYHALLMKFIR
jgi:hypothetical protein